MLGRHRHDLPGATPPSPPTLTFFAARPTRSRPCSSTTPCCGCRSSEPALAELVATAEAAVDVDQKWGALGPFLLTPVLTKYGLYERALDPHVCYPIEPEQFWKLFLPSYRDRVAANLSGATLLHLWSEAIVWSGYDFTTCPPPGSYLNDCFRAVDALDRFSRICDEEEVRRLMARQIAESERPAGPRA